MQRSIVNLFGPGTFIVLRWNELSTPWKTSAPLFRRNSLAPGPPGGACWEERRVMLGSPVLRRRGHADGGHFPRAAVANVHERDRERIRARRSRL